MHSGLQSLLNVTLTHTVFISVSQTSVEKKSSGLKVVPLNQPNLLMKPLGALCAHIYMTWTSTADRWIIKVDRPSHSALFTTTDRLSLSSFIIPGL